MPFSSERQKRYLAARHPEVFKRWMRKYGGQIVKHNQQAKRKRKAAR